MITVKYEVGTCRFDFMFDHMDGSFIDYNVYRLRSKGYVKYIHGVRFLKELIPMQVLEEVRRIIREKHDGEIDDAYFEQFQLVGRIIK